MGLGATAVLRRHGFLWPPDAHLWTPLLDWAFGGSLLTGVGYSRAGGEAPAFVFRDFRPLPWLRPSAKSEVRTLWMADSVRRRRAQRDLAWWLRLRQVRIRIGLLQRMGAPRRVELCHPLLDPGFVAALAAQPRRSEIEPVLLEGLRSPPSTRSGMGCRALGPRQSGARRRLAWGGCRPESGGHRRTRARMVAPAARSTNVPADAVDRARASSVVSPAMSRLRARCRRLRGRAAPSRR